MGSKAVLTDTTVKTINRCVCVCVHKWSLWRQSSYPPHHAHKQNHAVYTDNSEGTGKKKTLSKQACPNLAVITTSQSVHY